MHEPANFRQKARALIIFWFIAAATYFIIPKILFITPVMMPYMPMEEGIPFLSWSVLIYLTLYFQVSLMFLLVKERLLLGGLFWAYMFCGGVLSAFYFFFPTVHNFPAPVNCCQNWTDSMVVWLRSTDIAANQFPSGHTLFCMVGPAFLLATGQRKLGWAFFSWGLLISISTLTVKQHNALDVIFGILLALYIGYVFGRSCLKHRLGDSKIFIG